MGPKDSSAFPRLFRDISQRPPSITIGKHILREYGQRHSSQLKI